MAGCASHAEYDLMEFSRSLTWVRDLFDIQGRTGPVKIGKYSYLFKTCWAPETRVIRVWFDQFTNLTIDWEVIDL